MFKRSIIVASLLGTVACGAGAAPNDVAASEDELRTAYGDLLSTLSEAELDQWIAARAALVKGFDNICGDTICGGDFSNLATVRITCSSTVKTRKMRDCAWVLGGSIQNVDGRTGKITTEARTFTCKIPVATAGAPANKTTASAMVAALSAAGDDALNVPLPGTNASFYDGLVACFDGVSGSPIPPQTASFYSELGDHQWAAGEAEGLAWLSTKRKLAEGFDGVCGDSFCEGEYADITPLGFACSINENTKRVSRCSWSFAAANVSVGSRGLVATETTTKRCNIDIGAPVAELTTALAGEDPLNAKLPQRTTSIYDALIGCL